MPDLKNKVVSGVRWTGFSSVFTAVGYFLLMLFLVRTLEKSDFGLFAITGVVLNLGTLFMNFGISDAVIQKQDLTKSEFSTLYWINIVLSALVLMILLLTAPLIAAFYQQPELKPLIYLVGIGVLLLAPGLLFQALFQKEMNFKILSKIEVISFTGFALTVIVLAVLEFGVYSLVWGTLFRYFLKTLQLFVFSERSKFPKFSFSIQDMKTFRKFGLLQTMRGILVQFVLQLDVLILGKLLGAEATGIYDVLKGLLNKFAGLIAPMISTIGLPVFAANQNDLKKNTEIYLKILSGTNALTLPVFLIASVMAIPFVSVLFGNQWADSAPVFQWLCIAAAAMSLVRPQGSLITAMGKPEYGLSWNIYNIVLLPVVFYLGYKDGLVGISRNYALFNLFGVGVAFHFIVRRLLPVGWAAFAKNILPILGVSMVTGVIVSFVIGLTENLILQLLIGGGISAVLVPLGLMLFMPELFKDLRMFLGRETNR